MEHQYMTTKALLKAAGYDENKVFGLYVEGRCYRLYVEGRCSLEVYRSAVRELFAVQRTERGAHAS
jgi:hypothetical protein